MKQFTMRQFGFGENCYRRDFVVEMPDDVDPAMLSEDSLRRLADAAGAEWEYHDSYGAIVPSDHAVLNDGVPSEGLPVIHYDESATAAVNTGINRSNSEGAQR